MRICVRTTAGIIHAACASHALCGSCGRVRGVHMRPQGSCHHGGAGSFAVSKRKRRAHGEHADGRKRSWPRQWSLHCEVLEPIALVEAVHKRERGKP